MIPFNKAFFSKFWVLFIINAIIFAFFAWLLPIRFEDNDDVYMALIASGSYSGIPDAHLKPDEYVISFYADLGIEYYSPFRISGIPPHLALGWLSKIPLNEGGLESYMDIVDKNAIFVTRDKFEELSVNLKESISMHYHKNVEVEVISENGNYLMFKLNSID